MEFDVNKVFVSLSADDVKIGSKGYCADSLVTLKTQVEYEDKLAYGEVTRILDKDCLYRFRIDNIIDKAFFYLVEEPEEKENAKLRYLANEKCAEQLTKAKEIIKNLIDNLTAIDGEQIRELSVVKEAEQFLKESE